jgi:hypothetical protein
MMLLWKSIFRTFVGKDSAWRPAEPTTVSQQAVDQTFTEILLRLGEDMRGLFKQSDPFLMSASEADFEQLRRHNREHTHAKLPDITGHNLDGTERKMQRLISEYLIFTGGAAIFLKIWAWYVIKLFVLLTVTQFSAVGLDWVVTLGNGAG